MVRVGNLTLMACISEKWTFYPGAIIQKLPGIRTPASTRAVAHALDAEEVVQV
jgi:hypothetical protein